METTTPTGRAAGGFARAKALTAEQRTEIARKGAMARWSGLPQATHEGWIRIGEIEIPCAVLKDERRLITQSGMMRALGRARQAKGRQYYDSDVNLPAFLTAKNLKPFISRELEVTSSQIEFLTMQGRRAFGYEAELLPKICRVFVEAEKAGVLTRGQFHIAVRAHVLREGLINVGIVALIDEATGFQAVRPQDALQAYLALVIRKELAAWVKRFPDEFYENIYKLKGWPWPGMQKNRISVVGKYTRDLVYERIGPHVLTELEKKNPKDEKGNRRSKHHQWLTDDVGHPLLAQHLHALIMFQRLAITRGHGWNRFLGMVDQVLPKRNDTIPLPIPMDDDSPNAP
jgi:hypothetical protein